MNSNLSSSVAAAKSAKGFMSFVTYFGILLAIAMVIILGGSLEMIWVLINTLQLISYLPLMTPYFPDHVKTMFSIMKMTNLDISVLSNFFKKWISIDKLSVPINNVRFTQNGINSPLFLDN